MQDKKQNASEIVANFLTAAEARRCCSEYFKALFTKDELERSRYIVSQYAIVIRNRVKEACQRGEYSAHITLSNDGFNEFPLVLQRSMLHSLIQQFVFYGYSASWSSDNGYYCVDIDWS